MHVLEKHDTDDLILSQTHQKQSTSRKDKPVSDAPTTTILALTVTFGSMVNFLLMRLRANGAWERETGFNTLNTLTVSNYPTKSIT